MNKEQIICEVDNLISDSEFVMGSFIYGCLSKEIEKGNSNTEYDRLVKKFEKYNFYRFCGKRS